MRFKEGGTGMLTRMKTASLQGVNGYPVTVETDLHRGMPGFQIVGLADTTIKEAFNRIRPAIINSGYSFPREKVTVNLSPAGKPKEGSHFDLPIALGILLLTLGEEAQTEDTSFFGELSLDGRINPVRGALPLALCARKAGVHNIVLPLQNCEEAAVLEDVNIIPVSDLTQAICCVKDPQTTVPYKKKKHVEEAHSDLDFSEVIGQEYGKRALMIAAAGDHGILMMGGPGCGKTMMARRIPSILPRLSYEEQLELTGIYSVAGMLPEDEPVITSRPFRSPHHSISMAGLIGGGQKPRPGELSLAHRGVLFLDELGEFEGRAIDAMRQPVEDGFIRLNRNLEEIIFPSEVMIVAAANPCKCGNLWDEKKTCTCSSAQISSHMRKLTGPFADRIDMHVRVAQVAGKDLKEQEQKNKGMTSAQMREKVVEARRIQEERYRGMPHRENGWLGESDIIRYCLPDQDGQELLRQAYEKMGLTMRAYWKICKIARTIADLEGKETIGTPEVAEALQFRIMEKEMRRNGA